MPCDDYAGSDYSRLENKLSKVEAMLCALLTHLEKLNDGDLVPMLNRIDWNEAGVTRKQFSQWWEDHKAKDRQRKAREKEKAEKEAVRKRAYDKLTAKERKALGIE